MDEWKKIFIDYIKKYVSIKAVSVVLLYVAMTVILIKMYGMFIAAEDIKEDTLNNITYFFWSVITILTVVCFILGLFYIIKDKRKGINETEKEQEDKRDVNNRIEAFIIEQDDPERDKKFIEINKNVKKEYWALGVSLSALPKKENKLKQWANSGTDVRLCMLDADMTISELCRESIEHGYCSIKNYMESSDSVTITTEKILEMIQNAEIKCQQDCKDYLALYHVLINSVHFKEYYHTARDYKKTIQSSYTNLKNIADDIGKNKSGQYKLQLRFVDSFVPLSMTVKDASLDTGSMIVEFQLPFTNKKILIMLDKAEKEEMFNEFVELYKEVWERAKPANE